MLVWRKLWVVDSKMVSWQMGGTYWNQLWKLLPAAIIMNKQSFWGAQISAVEEQKRQNCTHHGEVPFLLLFFLCMMLEQEEILSSFLCVLS